ncbi:response regulator [Paenimyroides viscosum]|uniref:DNA-binding response regulator n=1 Tax=Paenimyroides viscosum TaxID=2488729 RepID=A0A3P1B3I6_9FLAO|nr:response regulator transcription factor [Paenimyroides viscosum]RRA95544.1 DNA-binding response regulator [Paenimyroides viscosum]
MGTSIAQQKITTVFINDKSPILDLTCNDLTGLGIEVLFRLENIEDGISQLSALKDLPDVCIIDLDFYDKNVLTQIQKLKKEYPSLHLIAHSDIDAEKVVRVLIEIGFSGYLLVGSDADDFRKAIETVSNGKKYFSVGVYEIAGKYLQ